MTDDEHAAEGAEEAIEDLVAPAATQGDVMGGRCTNATCVNPTCVGGTKVKVFCSPPTCKATGSQCTGPSSDVIVYEM